MKSKYFDSADINNDKITIHKSMIYRAINAIKNDADMSESGDRMQGRLDILNDMVDMFDRYYGTKRN